MNDRVLQSRIDGAEAYERFMVPALFAPWASKVCRAAMLVPGDDVLDLACGTGVLAREAVSHIGQGGRVTGVDPNPGMLAVARKLAPHVNFLEATAESLPLPDESLDVVLSQFGLMFFADRREALREVIRVLKPRGRFALAVWDSLAANPAYEAEVAVIRRIAGDRAADPIQAPFQLGEPESLQRLFHGAGMRSVALTTLQEIGRFPSVRAMVEADLRGWLPVVGVVLSETEIEAILRECDRQLARYVGADGAITFPMSAHVVHGSLGQPHAASGVHA